MNKVEEFWESLSQEEKDKTLNSFKNAYESYIDEEVKRKEDIEAQIAQLDADYKAKWAIEKEMTYSDEKAKLMEDRSNIYSLISVKKKALMQQENVIECLSNGGTTVEISDHKENTYNKVPDFRKVSSEFISFDEDNILIDKKPAYIPFIDEDNYRRKSYRFDVVRVTKDTYLLAADGFHVDAPLKNNFILLTLDQLVLTTEYYFVKAKAEARTKAEQQNKDAEERFLKMPRERREHYVMHRHAYNSLPAKIQKTLSKEDFEKLSLEEREAIYIPVKRYGIPRIKRTVELNSMPQTFHDMYEYWVDPSVYKRSKSGIRDDKNGRFGDPKVFSYWRAYVEMMEFKISDLKAQRKDLEETYQKALETSFGESNTSTVLKKEYGILVKRQNGDEIKPVEVEQIKEAWASIQSVFGDLKPNAEKFNMKVSHSGKKLMFAMKALGVFIPSMGTIGVSNKFGEKEFRSTMSHEVAHFIDYIVGKLNGKRWATDDYEDTAGVIAFTFRNNMNKPKEHQTDYINATKECFARCLQQYYMMKTYGDEATVNYSSVILEHEMPIYNVDSMVTKNTFNEKLVPLIEKFFEEQKDVFKTTFDLDGSDDIVPIAEEKEEPIKEMEPIEKPQTKAVNTELTDAIDGLEIMLASAEGESLQELNDAIEGLKLMQGFQ